MSFQLNTPNFKNPPRGFYVALGCIGLVAVPFQVYIVAICLREGVWWLLALTSVTLACLLGASYRLFQAARLRARKEPIQTSRDNARDLP
jgi:hypothetical protein